MTFYFIDYIYFTFNQTIHEILYIRYLYIRDVVLSPQQPGILYLRMIIYYRKKMAKKETLFVLSFVGS